MIIDQLGNAKLYSRINNRFAIALHYLETTDFSEMAVGKYEVEQKEIFAIVSEYNTKNIEEAKWEAHRKYIDIQYIIKGEEKMGYAYSGSMETIESYNPEKDIIFLKGQGDYLTAKAGTFLIFFPNDAHQPCVAITDSAPVKKVVIKVMV
jgi:YhcH/YjgK/YiaL family protein